MNYYNFNIGDYAGHTLHLEPLEDLAFRRLLDYLYLHEKPLPKDIDEIARLIRMRTHSDCIAYVLEQFFTLENDGYINKRAMSEIITYQEKCSKASKSAKARWGKNKNKNKALDSDAKAMRTHSEGNAIQETINNKQKTNIPYSAIAELYNSKFAEPTGCPKVRPNELNEKRKKKIKKFWTLTDQSNTLEWWQSYFNACSQFPNMQADAERSKGWENWKPNFDFLLTVDTLEKARENRL